jgi:hypothetical protein
MNHRNRSPLAALTHALREIELGLMARSTPRIAMSLRGRTGHAAHEGEHDAIARLRRARWNGWDTHTNLL